MRQSVREVKIGVPLRPDPRYGLRLPAEIPDCDHRFLISKPIKNRAVLFLIWLLVHYFLIFEFSFLFRRQILGKLFFIDVSG